MKACSLDRGLPWYVNGYCITSLKTTCLFCDLQWAKLQAKQVYGAPEAGEARPHPLEGVLEREEDEEEVPCRDDTRVEASKTCLIETASLHWQLSDGTSKMITASKKDINMCRLLPARHSTTYACYRTAVL